MKKIFLGFLIGTLLYVPILAFSAPNLGAKLKGKILLAVEDKGRTYYVHSDGNRYLITRETAQKVFEKLALGINNENIEQIPVGDLGINLETDTPADISEISTTTYISVPAKCDYKVYTDKITELNSEINRLNNSVTSYNLNASNLGNSQIVVEPKRDIKFRISDHYNQNGTYHDVEIMYSEDGKRKSFDATFSADDNGAFTNGKVMGSPAFGTSGVSGYDGQPSIFFQYSPEAIGNRTLSVTINGYTSTTTISGQVSKCAGHSAYDSNYFDIFPNGCNI